MELEAGTLARKNVEKEKDLEIHKLKLQLQLRDKIINSQQQVMKDNGISEKQQKLHSLIRVESLNLDLPDIEKAVARKVNKSSRSENIVSADSSSSSSSISSPPPKNNSNIKKRISKSTRREKDPYLKLPQLDSHQNGANGHRLQKPSENGYFTGGQEKSQPQGFRSYSNVVLEGRPSSSDGPKNRRSNVPTLPPIPYDINNDKNNNNGYRSNNRSDNNNNAQGYAFAYNNRLGPHQSNGSNNIGKENNKSIFSSKKQSEVALENQKKNLQILKSHRQKLQELRKQGVIPAAVQAISKSGVPRNSILAVPQKKSSTHDGIGGGSPNLSEDAGGSGAHASSQPQLSHHGSIQSISYRSVENIPIPISPASDTELTNRARNKNPKKTK